MLVWTIGYGGRTGTELLEDLRDYRVTHLLDVRSHPQSNWYLEFSAGILCGWLPRNDIEYVFFGRWFGGRVDPELKTPEAYIRRPQYRTGLRELQELGEETTPCLMCAEADPVRCHRARLVAPGLIQEGIEVRHILPDGTDIAHEDLEWPPEQRSLEAY